MGNLLSKPLYVPIPVMAPLTRLKMTTRGKKKHVKAVKNLLKPDQIHCPESFNSKYPTGQIIYPTADASPTLFCPCGCHQQLPPDYENEYGVEIDYEFIPITEQDNSPEEW